MLIQRKVTKRKDTRHARPSGALRCSNEPAGCELAIAQTVTSRTLRFILCFSASLNRRFKVKSGVEGLKTKEKPSSSFRRASSRNPFYIKTLDTGLRRYDGCVVRENCTFVSGVTGPVLTWVLILIPLLCCRAQQA